MGHVMELTISLVLASWCLLPLPLAVAVGRSFRQGSQAEGCDGPDVRRTFDLAA